MAESFEDQDLSGATFWGVDLTGAHFRDVNLTNATVTSAWLINVDIDALIENVSINGVDVTAYVNERDPWYPLRAMLRPADPEGMRTAWAALEDLWAATIERARALPEEKLHESVNGEWSFVQTVRHLVFATDKWFTVPVLGGSFHPMVLPNSGSDALDWPGRDRAADPTIEEALEVRSERSQRFREYLSTVTDAELDRTVEVLENGPNPVRECVYTVLEEEFGHNRYATRDLAQLE
jgi:DinB family protein/pentapeptide repeat protein